jgi:hypothetical protein
MATGVSGIPKAKIIFDLKNIKIALFLITKHLKIFELIV